MSNEKKLGQESAFPELTHEWMPNTGTVNTFQRRGMSKRFYAACAAMQGLLSYGGIIMTGNESKIPQKVLVERSYQIADELLKQENQ